MLAWLFYAVMYMEWVLLAQMGFALARPSPASHTDLSERTTLSSEENSTSTYESSELSITRRSGALTRRATLYECESDQAKSSPDKTQLVEDALHWCGVLAGYGKRAAQDTSNTNFETWFRNDDQATREHVAKVYEEIENECGGHNEQSKTGILCKDQETSPGKMGCDYREGMEMYFDAKTRKQKKLKSKYLISAHTNRWGFEVVAILLFLLSSHNPPPFHLPIPKCDLLVNRKPTPHFLHKLR